MKDGILGNPYPMRGNVRVPVRRGPEMEEYWLDYRYEATIGKEGLKVWTQAFEKMDAPRMVIEMGAKIAKSYVEKNILADRNSRRNVR